MLQDMNTYEYTGFHMLPRPIPWISTAGEGRRCGQNSGPSMPCRGWKLRHRGVTYCKAILRSCAMDDPLVLKEHWTPGLLLPKNIHTKTYFKPKQFWEWQGKSNNQLKARTTSDMTKDAIWPACLDLYDVCFIVSWYRKSFFLSALGTWLSADAWVVAGKHTINNHL